MRTTPMPHLDWSNLLYQGRTEEGWRSLATAATSIRSGRIGTVRLAWLLYQARHYTKRSGTADVLAADPDQVQALWFLGSP